MEKTEKNYAKRGKNIKIVLKLCVVLRWYNRTRFEKKNVKTERT